MDMNRDRATGLLLILVGIITTVMVSQFSMGMTFAYPGPKLFPLIASVGLILLGFGILRQQNVGKNKVALNATLFKRLGSIFGMSIIYVLALKYLGFLISSPVYLYGVVTVFAKASSKQKTKAWQRILFAVIVAFLVYAFYVYLFGSKLPRGIIFE